MAFRRNSACVFFVIIASLQAAYAGETVITRDKAQQFCTKISGTLQNDESRGQFVYAKCMLGHDGTVNGAAQARTKCDGSGGTTEEDSHTKNGLFCLFRIK